MACRPWPVPPRPCSSVIWPMPRPPSGSAPAASCSPTMRRSPSPSSSPPWRPSTRVGSTSASAGPREPTRRRREPCAAGPISPPTRSPRTWSSSSTTWPTPVDHRPTRPPSPGTSLPELWLLGSSTFSAQLAGLLGLPFSFAYHFCPVSWTRPSAATGHRSVPRFRRTAPTPWWPSRSCAPRPRRRRAGWLALRHWQPAAAHRPAGSHRHARRGRRLPLFDPGTGHRGPDRLDPPDRRPRLGPPGPGRPRRADRRRRAHAVDPGPPFEARAQSLSLVAEHWPVDA